jgi:hypothetical protein
MFVHQNGQQKVPYGAEMVMRAMDTFERIRSDVQSPRSSRVRSFCSPVVFSCKTETTDNADMHRCTHNRSEFLNTITGTIICTVFIHMKVILLSAERFDDDSECNLYID